MSDKLRMKKRWGQNFLQDKNILKKIIDAAELKEGDTILEIGTGGGFLTSELAQSKATIHTIEIDQEKFDFSKNNLSHHTNIEFILGDFLIKAKDIFEQLETGKTKVIANIPYNITTPIIEKLLFYQDKLEFIEIMIQKEVAQRLTANPGTKEYGSLTLFVNYHADVKNVCNVSRNSFYPVPAVDSRVIKITPKENPKKAISEDTLFRVIKACFWGRRKTMQNCLKNSPYTKFNQNIIDKIAIDYPEVKTIRGEKLSLAKFIDLADHIYQLVS